MMPHVVMTMVPAWLIALSASAGILQQDGGSRFQRSFERLDELVTFEVLDYVVTPARLRAMCDVLQLTADERRKAEAAYESYWPKAVALDQRAARALAEGNILDRAREASEEASRKTYFSNPPAPEDEADQLWRRVGELSYQVKLKRIGPLRECDVLTKAFFDSLASILERPREALAPAERLLRREVFLRQATYGATGLTFAIDFGAFLKRSFQEDAELRWLQATPKVAAELDRIALEHEKAVDLLLTRHHVRLRRDPELLHGWYRPQDADYWPRAREAAVAHAGFRDALHRSRDEVMRLITDHAGEAEALRWRVIMERVAFTEIYHPLWCDQMVEWLAARPDATLEQLEQIRVLQQEFDRRHTELRFRCYDATATLICNTSVNPRTYQSGLESRALIMLEIHRLSREIIDRALVVLNPDQQTALKKRVFEGWTAPLFGPSIDARLLEQLGRLEEYDFLHGWRR